MKHTITLVIGLFSLLFYQASYAEHRFGLITVSKEGYYFHTDEKLIENTSWLETISSGVLVNFVSPIESKQQSTLNSAFYFHAEYAYKIEGETLSKLGLIASPAILLNSHSDKNFDKHSLVSNSCSSREGGHYSVWKKGNHRFERVWSIYLYAGYSTEPTCKQWELAD